MGMDVEMRAVRRYIFDKYKADIDHRHMEMDTIHIKSYSVSRIIVDSEEYSGKIIVVCDDIYWTIEEEIISEIIQEEVLDNIDPEYHQFIDINSMVDYIRDRCRDLIAEKGLPESDDCIAFKHITYMIIEEG